MADMKLLLVADESEAARRAVAYVGKVVGRRRGFRVVLAYVLPPLPPVLLEFGGSEDPEAERRGQAGLKADQRRWLAAARRAAQPVLDRARRELRAAGLAPAALTTHFLAPVDGRGLAEDILALARSRGCRTVVVGRQAHSWVDELIEGDLAEDLMRRGKGFSVLAVE